MGIKYLCIVFEKYCIIYIMLSKNWNINPESLLPLHGDVWIYWKDKAGCYLNCNNFMVCKLGLHSPIDIVGKTDFEIGVSEDEALYYREQDNMIKHNKIPMQFQDSATLLNQKLNFLVIKMPLLNLDTNNVEGVVGISYYLDTPKNLTDNLWRYINTFNRYNLSEREKECLALLIAGKTAKEIGNELKISYRTVEHHLEKIKRKANVSSKSKLINQVLCEHKT